MIMIAKTPKPPYYAVIFTSLRSENDTANNTANDDGYAKTAEHMVNLASQQSGFLGIESAREGLGITVSYWQDLESIRAWKVNAEHQLAQRKGYELWYESFKVRITKVERDYGV
ncbi:antibiotic biosynthesis monooxygenase [Thalassotalea euphylliae]|uniref:Antibiotic biosynthesis monooxygenase n=2 Tax=Thalassotalea euphylliae TaxID=1655234 RepID=A0A3E0UIA3_9GAMM|nr:antibiotic biosynthesis monooxygenase [Thalassotalea euphylliae]REL36347.1 antibiotic biosynthesis monooxygenase [Thalassotalea euphylliae]